MSRHTTNKRAVETFLVGKSDQALYNTAGSGDHINNATTGAVRLADGQLGFFSGSSLGSVALNIATDATPTVTEAPIIYIAQGTEDSANPAGSTKKYPLFPRPFERTGDIDGRNSITITKQAYQAPTQSIWVIGDTGAVATGGLSAADLTEYRLGIGFYGGYFDTRLAASMNTNQYAPFFKTPDYTALGTTNPLDHMIQNLVYNVNKNSVIMTPNRRLYGGGHMVYALALDLSGDASGSTAVADLSAGNLAVMTVSGKDVNVSLTAEQVTNLKAALPSGSSIVKVNTATAGGTANIADAFALIAVDRREVFDDEFIPLKTTLKLGLKAGFASTVWADETSNAFEGNGTSRQLRLKYKATHGQRKYNLDHTQDPVVEFANPIVNGTTYTTYIIRHYDSAQVDTGNVVISPQTAYVAIPVADTTTIGQFDTAINAYAASVNATVQTA
jgi:hypothetical protein